MKFKISEFATFGSRYIKFTGNFDPCEGEYKSLRFPEEERESVNRAVLAAGRIPITIDHDQNRLIGQVESQQVAGNLIIIAGAVDKSYMPVIAAAWSSGSGIRVSLASIRRRPQDAPSVIDKVLELAFLRSSAEEQFQSMALAPKDGTEVLLKWPGPLLPESTPATVAEDRFVAAGHAPENKACDHRQWDEKKHGRYCPCGTVMLDYGD